MAHGDESGGSDGAGGDAGGDADESSTGAADAFSLVGNEHRVAILRALLGAHADPDTPYPTPFAVLRERAGVDVSAQFAYHLDELVGSFVAKTGDGYRLRYQGWKAAAALAAGTYTDQPAFGPTAAPGDCPHCDAEALHASYGDAWLTVACHGCERVLTRYPFPPRAAAARLRDDAGIDDLLGAFDARVRSHFSLAVDGVCPECAGRMQTALEPVEDPGVPETGRTDTRGDGHALQAVADCAQCGNHLTLPVGCVLLGNQDALGWASTHGVDRTDRPFWRVPELVADTQVERTGTDPLQATVALSTPEGTEHAVVVTDSLDVHPSPGDDTETTPVHDANEKTTPVHDENEKTTPIHDENEKTTPVHDENEKTTPVHDANEKTTDADR